MYIKMKKILIPLACLSALTLSACQTSTKPTGQASSSKTASTHKSSSKSKAAPKENSQAKKPKSAKQSSAVKNSSSSASPKASSSSSSPTSSSSSSSAVSSSSSNAPADYQSLFEGETLTSFVNKYGESPAAYLSEHYGLSPKEALYATPDSLETFGEMQSESMYRKGQDPFAN